MFSPRQKSGFLMMRLIWRVLTSKYTGLVTELTQDDVVKNFSKGLQLQFQIIINLMLLSKDFGVSNAIN